MYHMLYCIGIVLCLSTHCEIVLDNTCRRPRYCDVDSDAYRIFPSFEIINKKPSSA